MTNKFEKEHVCLHLKPYIAKENNFKVLLITHEQKEENLEYTPIIYKVTTRDLTVQE